MAKFTKVLFLISTLTFGLTPFTAIAATSPSLGTAQSYSILAGSEVTNVGATTISGDVGISPGIGPSPHYSGFGTVTFDPGSGVHDADGAALLAQADKNLAFAALNSQGCTNDFGAVTTELAGMDLIPGVYCSTSFHLSSGVLTLTGTSADVWVFKSASDIIISGGNASRVVFSGGGLACNVWWTAVSSTTFDAGSSLVGNILADTSITLAAGASLEGRALARTAAVTLSGNAITAPSCSVPTGNLTVTKTVINDNSGTNVVADFNLFVGVTGVTSGAATAFAPGSYVVSEANLPGYTAGVWGGSCAADGHVVVASGDNLTCTITNNDTPPSGGGSSGSHSNPTPNLQVVPNLSVPVGLAFQTPTNPNGVVQGHVNRLPVTGTPFNIKDIIMLISSALVLAFVLRKSVSILTQSK